MTMTNVVLQVAAKMWRRSFLCNVAELRDLIPFLHVFLLVVVQVYSILLSSASWHKSHHLKFNSSKQNKARKHKSKSVDDYNEERPPSKSKS